MAHHGANNGFGRLMAEKLLAGGDRVYGTVRYAAAVKDLADKREG
jgi:NAD(P)-dependent dehydrogenase (short-subunit alcohol dehydrogenase family)